MKRIQHIILAGMASVLLPAGLLAQTQPQDSTLSRTVVVEQEYNPDIMDAAKINVVPQVEPPVATKSAVEYDSRLVPAQDIPAATMQAYRGQEAFPKALPGYVRVGYGNYGNLDVRANYLFNLTNRDKLNLTFTMDGMDGSLDLPANAGKWDSYYYRTHAGIDYRHAFSKMDMNVAGHFDLNNFNFLPDSVYNVFEVIRAYGSLVLVGVVGCEAMSKRNFLFQIIFLALCARPVRRPLFREGGVRAASLLFVTLPVTLSAAVLPLSNLLDSILIVRLVGRYASDATALYGLYAGGASTIVNLPVSVCYGIAAACVPAVARAKDAREAEEKTCFALMCTLLIALPASLFLFLFPAQVTSFLFRSLPSQESAVLAGLVLSSFEIYVADSIAALCVAFVVMFVSYRLGKRSIFALIDGSLGAAFCGDFFVAIRHLPPFL